MHADNCNHVPVACGGVVCVRLHVKHAEHGVRQRRWPWRRQMHVIVDPPRCVIASRHMEIAISLQQACASMGLNVEILSHLSFVFLGGARRLSLSPYNTSEATRLCLVVSVEARLGWFWVVLTVLCFCLCRQCQASKHTLLQLAHAPASVAGFILTTGCWRSWPTRKWELRGPGDSDVNVDVIY